MDESQDPAPAPLSGPDGAGAGAAPIVAPSGGPLAAPALDPSAVAVHLRGQIEVAADEAGRAAAALALAAHQADRENDVAAAVATLVQATLVAPAQRALWPALAALHARQGDLVASSQARSRELALWPPGPERQARLLALAALAGRQNDGAGALAALEELLVTEPASPAARALLVGLRRATQPPDVDRALLGLLLGAQRAAQAWPELVATLEARGRALGTGEEAAAAWREAATVRGEVQHDPEGAFNALAQAYAAAPALPGLRADLEAAAQRARRDEALAAALAGALPQLASHEEGRAARASLAQVLARLGRTAEAIEQIQAAAGGGLPDDVGVLTTLAELLGRENRDAERAEALTALVAALPAHAAAQRRTASLALATLCAGRLGDHARAVAALRALLAEAPRDLEALRMLADLAQAGGQAEAELGARVTLAGLGADDPSLLEDLTRQGEILLGLGRPEDAVAPLLAALSRRREHPPAVAALEALVDELADVTPLAQALEPVYVAALDHAKLAWILTRRLATVADVPARMALLRRIGELYEHHLDQPDRAFALARQALALDPADVGTRMWLERLAASDPSALARLATAYAEEAAAAPPALAVTFWRRAAAILHERLQDAAGAIAAYRALLVLEPRDERALAGLEALYRAAPDPAALVQVLRDRLVQAAGQERRRELLAEIATLEADALAAPAAAAATLRALLAEAPDDAPALARLAALYAALDAPEQEAALYASERQRLAGRRGREAVTRRQALALKQARLCAGPLGDGATAAALCGEVLAEEPTHAEAIAWLEAEAAHGRPELAALWERALRGRGDWPRLAALYEAQLAAATDPAARQALCATLAELQEGPLGAPLQAFLARARSYAERPGEPSLLAPLVALAEKHGFAEELAGVLSEGLDAIVELPRRREVLLRLAALTGGPLGQPDVAVGHLRRLLADDPSDAAALAALDAQLTTAGRWAQLVDLLDRRIELAADPGERRALRLRLARIWAEQLQDPEAAARVVQAVLVEAPADAEALAVAEALLRAVSDWDRLADNLAAQARLHTEPQAQRDIQARLGTLCAEELGDIPGAIAAWQRALAAVPQDPEAFAALQTLLAAEERWEELAALLREGLAHAADPAAKLALSRHLGAVLGDKLHRDDDAWTSWHAVLAQDPASVEALEALLPLALARAAWTDYVALAQRLLPLVDGPRARALRLPLLDVLVDGLGDRDAALALAQAVRAQEPPAVAELERAAAAMVRAEAWEPAALLIARAAAVDDQPSAQLARHRQVAHLYADRLGRPEAARPAYEAILALAPADGAAHAALAALLREGGQWRRLVALHEAFLPHAPAAQHAALLAEIRDCYAGPLGERDLAFVAACRVVHAAPDPAAMDRAEALAAAAGTTEAWVGVLEDSLAALPTVADQVAVLRRMAAVQAGPLADGASAEATLERLLALSPADLPALVALAELGAASERYDKQLAALERQLPLLPGAAERAALLAQMATIWGDKVGDLEQAVPTWERVLALAPDDEAAAAALADALASLGRWPAWAEVTRRRIAHAPTTTLPLRIALAERLEGPLADPEGAIAAWADVRALSPDDPRAVAALERLYASGARWPELRALLASEAARTADPAAQARLWAKLARVDEEALGHLADAAACLEAAWAQQPSDLTLGRELARLLRAQAAWPRLAEVLGRISALTAEGPARAEVDVALGELCYRELGRVDRAEQHFLRARAQAPRSRAACHALGTLYERSGNWQQALEMIASEADILGTDVAALPLWLRAGRIHEDMLLDRAQARAAYERALAIDPAYGPALAARKEMARAEQEWDRYQALLTIEAETAPDAEQRAELWVEAAAFARDIGGDDVLAEAHLNRALLAVPRHRDASGALADLLARRGAWDEALGHYAVAAAAIDAGREPAAACQVALAMGRGAVALGRPEAAAAHFGAALEACPTSLPAAEGLGEALVGLARWDEALRVTQGVLLQHRETLTAGEQVALETQMGAILTALEQPGRAAGHYARALELAPAHLPALAGQVTLTTAAGDWEGAARALERLAAAAPDGERPATLRRLATVARDHLHDLPRAREALERARRAGDVSADLWEELGELEASLGQGARAVEAMEAAAAATAADDHEARAHRLLRAGALAETSLNNLARAVARYSEALDAAPRLFAAFEAIERILAGRQDWALLEGHTRAMIGRARDFTPAMKAVLWRSLAENYHRHLGDVPAAIAAYEVVLRLAPDTAGIAEILVVLYGQTPATRAKAIALTHATAAQAETPIAALHTLRQLYQAERDFDAVFVMVDVLAFLRAADADEQKLHAYLRRGVPLRPARGLSEDGWRHLLDAEVHAPIGSLAAALTRAAPEALTVPAKELGLRPRDQVDVRQSKVYVASLARQAAGTLSLPPLDLYRRPASVEALRLINARPPALLAGESHPIFTDGQQTLALFHLGRNLAYARPELFLARIYPGNDLRDLLLGLCLTYSRALTHPGDPRAVARWAQAFERLPAPVLERLQPAAQAAFSALTDPEAPARYAAAVERSACRAGLIVAADLAAAARGVTEGGDGAAALPARDRIRDLALFAASPAHLALRRMIGAALVEGQASS